MSVSESLKSDYRLVFFNVESIEAADTLLFAEDHVNQTCRELFAKLAAYLAENSPVTIFAEQDAKAMQDPERISRVKKYLGLEGFEKIEQISWTGWDYSSPELEEAQDTAVASELRRQDRAVALYRAEQQMEREVGPIDQFIQAKFGPYPEAGVIPPCDPFNPGYWSPLFDLEATDRQIIVEYVQTRSELEIEKITAERELTEAENECGVAMDRFGELVDQQNLNRTASMVTSLQQLRELREAGKLTSKALFQAGANHLPIFTESADKRGWDLTSLYRELELHRAVILVPKVLGELTPKPNESTSS